MSSWEISIIESLRSVATSFLDNLFKVITVLGEKEVLIVFIIGIYFMYSKKVGQRIAYSIFSSLHLNNIVKGIVARPRPWTHASANYQPVRPETATGFSFPSGHTQNSAVLYSSFAIETNKKPMFILAGILIILIGFSRVFLGVHFPSDVVVGIILGVGCAVVGAIIHKRCEQTFKTQYILYLITFALFLPFVFIFWKKDYNTNLLYRDFYTAIAFFGGYIIAVGLENRFVNFIDEASLLIRVIRTLIAILLVVGILFGLKAILPKENILFDMLRYFLIPIIGIGLFPILGKGKLFKTK